MRWSDLEIPQERHPRVAGERLAVAGLEVPVDAALRAIDPEAANAQEGRILPKWQVLDFDPPARMWLTDRPLALTAGVQPSKTFELKDDGSLPAARFDRQLGDAIPWKSEQLSETMKAHRVGPPAVLAREQWKFTLLDVSFSGFSLHNFLS